MHCRSRCNGSSRLSNCRHARQLRLDRIQMPVSAVSGVYRQMDFGSPVRPFITAFVPRGGPPITDCRAGLTRRFSHGLTFQSAYTWSHTIDNSTADFHTSDITPRRPQDFFNFTSEKATPLWTVRNGSRGHGLRLAVLQGWKLDDEECHGNWTFSPVYTLKPANGSRFKRSRTRT